MIELVQAAPPPVTLCMCCAAEEVQSLKAGDSGLDLALATRPFLAYTGVADLPMLLACADRVQERKWHHSAHFQRCRCETEAVRQSGRRMRRGGRAAP